MGHFKHKLLTVIITVCLSVILLTVYKLKKVNLSRSSKPLDFHQAILYDKEKVATKITEDMIVDKNVEVTSISKASYKTSQPYLGRFHFLKTVRHVIQEGSLPEVVTPSGQPISEKEMKSKTETRVIAKELQQTTSSTQPPSTTTEYENFIRKRPAERFYAHKKKMKKKDNIVFLKTHKTGSSTIQNILMRYGDNKNLTFAVPRKVYQLGYPYKNVKDFVLPLNRSYNIMCHHARFNYDSIRTFMPNNSVYISIVRHPLKVFESAFNYFSFASCMNITGSNPLLTFLRDPGKYFRAECQGVATRNLLLYDFGIEPQDMDNQTIISENINEVKRIFPFVIVAEYIDESLVLLKDLLNWDLLDILYISHNVRSSNNIEKLTMREKVFITQWNYADLQLYANLTNRFLEQVKQYGKTKLKREVTQLREMKASWQEYCIKGKMEGSSMNESDSADQKPYSGKTYGFLLTKEGKRDKTCQQLTRAELQFADYLFDKMNSSMYSTDKFP